LVSPELLNPAKVLRVIEYRVVDGLGGAGRQVALAGDSVAVRIQAEVVPPETGKNRGRRRYVKLIRWRHANLTCTHRASSACRLPTQGVRRGVSPMIWRRLLVRSDSTIADLHTTLQLVLGWSDEHLHRFVLHGKDYGSSQIGGIGFSDDPHQVQLADCGVRLREL